MREHWDNCVTHFDNRARSFIAEFFAEPSRRCFLVAGAGFDPRSQIIPASLANAMGDNLHAMFIREERGEASAVLKKAADANEANLRSLIKNSQVVPITIFDPSDNATIGGNQIASALRNVELPNGVTDVILDMSALSMGIAFPAAKLLLAIAESSEELNFHVMLASNPELDASIVGEPAERVLTVRGFAGNSGAEQDVPKARIWLPQLAKSKKGSLDQIKASLTDLYKVCPILPFPARDPRRADTLIEEFGEQIRGDWQVDARDYMYVSERNPLDSYRSIEMLKKRYDKTVDGIFEPQIILSPVGSKVMAAGAMMAAIKHDLTVQYVEALRYDISPEAADADEMDIVHIWLHGPIYAGFQ
ncbi:hypothetical protein QEZ48_07585 [Aquamicrobium lusatiense]|uniref:hypothetical protein n=1 Tax=Aquamicrobium lusatiense TaxID=89772 RepID=UPI0024581151|nr:hypothetical protein [Aquamicrobium lusatiense]MDH4990691.1 hypothetical protein [Aquamicrobium lusatiense]